MPAASSYDEQVVALTGRLLDVLKRSKNLKASQQVKALGWLAVTVGESFEKGALAKARSIVPRLAAGESSKADSLGVGLCVLGCQIMDYSVGLYEREKSKV